MCWPASYDKRLLPAALARRSLEDTARGPADKGIFRALLARRRSSVLTLTHLFAGLRTSPHAAVRGEALENGDEVDIRRRTTRR